VEPLHRRAGKTLSDDARDLLIGGCAAEFTRHQCHTLNLIAAGSVTSRAVGLKKTSAFRDLIGGECMLSEEAHRPEDCRNKKEDKRSHNVVPIIKNAC